MNAPLPRAATQASSAQVYDQTARTTNEVAGRLAARLSTETRGEVLFSLADRGRYATDASIYQVTPVGVFVPRSSEDVALALEICRSSSVPIVPRGGGTSQCGQTVGAGLVIDFSKHVRNILGVDVPNRTVEVEPGIVLDHLNAALKQHGLWYPVDVSTSAQATLGGMAGNNSCGSRSIAYGNMVHNVLGAKAWTADGTLIDFGTYAQSTGRGREIGDYVRTLADALRPDIDARWPKVLRRVAGYNLDIFHNQNERPYTADGSVNLAHLLIGSEGTLALTKSLTLRLSELPRAKVLGVVNFPTFYKAMDSAQHIVKLGSDGSLSAVELVDRTMIELALQNPAFAQTVRTALAPKINNGKPDAILLVEFSGASKADITPKIRQLVDLMGDLGLPGSVVEMIDDAPQKEPLGGPQGRTQHHDEPQGRWQTGQLHRGLRGTAGTPRRIHRRTDAGVPQARQQGHLVCARLGGHPACAPDPGHATRRCSEDACHRRGSIGAWCASSRAPTAANTATDCAGASGSSGSSGPRSRRHSARSNTSWTRTTC